MHNSAEPNPKSRDYTYVHIWRAIGGGLLGTAALGVFVGELAPRLGLAKVDFPHLLGTLFSGVFGFRESTFWTLVGWLLFALGGTGWAMVYALYVYGRIPGPGWLQGLLFGGVAVFLVTSLVFFPVLSWIHPLMRADEIPAPGLFGCGLDGGQIVLANFLGHCLFGFTLGVLYQRRLVFSS